MQSTKKFEASAAGGPKQSENLEIKKIKIK
jgi:hypothetical protein